MLDELNTVAQYLGYISLVAYVAGILWLLMWFVRGIALVSNRIRYDRKQRRAQEADFDLLRRTWIDADKRTQGKHSANDHPTDVFVVPIPGRMGRDTHHDTVDLSTLPAPRDELYDYQEDLNDQASSTSQGS